MVKNPWYPNQNANLSFPTPKSPILLCSRGFPPSKRATVSGPVMIMISPGDTEVLTPPSPKFPKRRVVRRSSLCVNPTQTLGDWGREETPGRQSSSPTRASSGTSAPSFGSSSSSLPATESAQFLTPATFPRSSSASHRALMRCSGTIRPVTL